MTDVKSELNQIFKTVFKDDDLLMDEQMTAKDVKGWDSLAHIELITAIESHFHIKLKLKELTKMNDVGAIIQLIQAKLC
jgi:acyl carrier protein